MYGSLVIKGEMNMRLALVLLCIPTVALAAVITDPVGNKSTGEKLTATEFNNLKNAILNEMNGELDAANIEDGSITETEIKNDAITPSKVDEDNTTPFTMLGISATTGTITNLTAPTITVSTINAVTSNWAIAVASSVWVKTGTTGEVQLNHAGGVEVVNYTSGGFIDFSSTTRKDAAISYDGRIQYQQGTDTINFYHRTAGQIGGWKSDGLFVDATDKFYLDGGSDTYITESAANTVDFYTNNTQVLRLGSGANVGIGTTTVTSQYSNYQTLRLAGSGGSHIKLAKADVVYADLVADSNFFYIRGGGGGIKLGTGAEGTGTVGLTLSSGNDVIMEATKKLYLDGGGNTYITEVEADRIGVYVGGSAIAYFDNNSSSSTGVQFYSYGEVSAAWYIDRTPYPASKQEAYDSVLSMGLKEDGDGVDHQALSSFVQAKGTAEVEIDGKIQEVPVVTGRDLSATVSAQNEVIKDLISRIQALETQLLAQDARLKALEQDGAILK